MILSRFICKLFGHKKRLTSRDGDRAICPRCAGTTFTFKAVNEYLNSDSLGRLLIDGADRLIMFPSFWALKNAQQADTGDNLD